MMMAITIAAAITINDDKMMTMRASMRQRVIRHGLAAILAASPIPPRIDTVLLAIYCLYYCYV